MKKLLYNLIFPQLWVVVIFTLLCIAGMALVAVNGFAPHPVYYVIYAVSFYAVCILTAYIIKNGANAFKSVKGRIYNNKFGNRFLFWR